MQSLQSKIFFYFIRILHIREWICKFAHKKRKTQSKLFLRTEIQKYAVAITHIDQRKVYTLGEKQETSRHIIYLHGGMYTLGINVGHKNWVKKIAKDARCRVTLIDYPLAPESTYSETVKMVTNTYDYLMEAYPQDTFILMGDSAGGGLALVLAQYLRDNHHPRQPQKLILYSPWIKLDMDCLELQSSDHKDILLDIDLLHQSAQNYAGGIPLSHPYLSPFYAGCQHIGEVHIFYGSNELLAYDIEKFKQRCELEQARVTFTCFEGLQHDFQLFLFLPESKQVFKRSIEIISP